MNKKEVVIVDYGIGNIFSVKQAFEAIGAEVIVTSDFQTIEGANRLVVPGVGAFGMAMSALNDLNLINSILYAASQKVPILGICLGMQMLLEESDEMGLSQGLGLISGRVEKYPKKGTESNSLKIPQINWHELVPSHSELSWENSLLSNYKVGDAVYFVHSFVARPSSINHILASYICDGELIPAVIEQDNVIGCQFHPEKSGEVGLKILKNFMAL